MGFQTFIKRAFGFSVEELDEENFNHDSVDSQLIPTLQPIADNTARQTTAQPYSGPLPDDMPIEIIDGILSVVNESLPSLVRDCLDRDAQRMRLYEAMGVQFKEYIARLANSASTEAHNAVNDDRQRLQAELEQIKSERKLIEQKRDEQKEQILSEQRQRRALTERVRDLEGKLNSFDAEKEQYQLEIKSLMNKLRASEVRENDEDEFKRRIDELQRELKAAHAEKLEMQSEIQAKDQEINELTAKISEMESAGALAAALSARNEMIEAKQNEPAEPSAESVAQQAEADEPHTDEEAAAPKPTAPKKRRGRPRKEPAPEVITSDDMTEVDWLLPGGAPATSSSQGGVSDPDFGYQPPQRTLFHDDDNQPTLF